MSGFVADHPGARVRPSPNFGERRDGRIPSLVILHYTGMASGAAAEDWLADPASQVSAHYLVHEDGRIVQMVREADRAWHAGRSAWHGETDINSASVGIEIVNPGHQLGYRRFPRRQIDAVVALCAGIKARHGILPQGFLAHSDVAPGRKVDPGEWFPWGRLAREGLARPWRVSQARMGQPLGEGDSGESVRRLQADLAAIGYNCPVSGTFDRQTRIVVEAFQRRFRRARVDGIADPATCRTAALISPRSHS